MRPRGPLDAAEEVDGAAIETLVLQSLRAKNANRDLDVVPLGEGLTGLADRLAQGGHRNAGVRKHSW